MPIIHAGFESSLPAVRVQTMAPDTGYRSFLRLAAGLLVSSCRFRSLLLAATIPIRKAPLSRSFDLSLHSNCLTARIRNSIVSFIGRLRFRPSFPSVPLSASPFEDEHRLPSRFVSLLHRVRREAGVYSGLTSETPTGPQVPARELPRRDFSPSSTPPRIFSAMRIQSL